MRYKGNVSGGGGAPTPNVNADVRYYTDWNAPGNFWDDQSDYATPNTKTAGVTLSSAQQIFGQDTALFPGGASEYVYVDQGATHGHLVPGINDNWWCYAWCWPAAFVSVNTIYAIGPRSGTQIALLTFTGFTPGPGAIAFESNNGYGSQGGSGYSQLRLSDWNLVLAQWDATARQGKLWHDDGAGTMVLLGTTAVAPLGASVARVPHVEQKPLVIGGQENALPGGGSTTFGWSGHIGPFKLAMGEGIDLWPTANFDTPIVADASPP